MLNSLQQLTLDEALALGRAVFLVFSFVLASVTFAAWRRAALRHSELAGVHAADVVKRHRRLPDRHPPRPRRRRRR
jgi:hypothetical protein